MSYLKAGFLAILAIVLVTISIANREPVTFSLLPADLSGLMGFSWAITLPLYLIIFVAIGSGILIGFVWEWMREYHFRSSARNERRQRQRLEKQVRDLKVDEAKGDDVLAILENPSKS